MPSDSKFIKVTELWFLFFFLIIKNTLFYYLYQKNGIDNESISHVGIYLTTFGIFDWLIFWWASRYLFKNKLLFFLIPIISILLTSFPYFLNHSPIKLDYDNLMIQAGGYFLAFLIFIFSKMAPKLVLIPVFMSLIPLINLNLGNSFSANWSIFNPFFETKILEIVISDKIYLDVGIVIIKSIFWIAVVILFFEMNHQYFGLFSWRFEVALPLNKLWLVSVWFIFKTLIYWLVASLIVIALGQNNMPYFSNKVALFLNAVGISGMLAIFTIYYRKYISLYFYDKMGTSNWLFFGFFLPIIDLFALIIILFIPITLIKKFAKKAYSPKNIIYAIIIALLSFGIYSYYSVIKSIPSSEHHLIISLALSRIILPIVISISAYWFLNKVSIYIFIMSFLSLGSLFFIFWAVPQIEKSGDIELTINTVQFYFQTMVFLFLIYPVLYFERYLKIKK